MKIFWWSNAPWAHSGYGNMTNVFWKRIRDKLGHEVTLGSNYGLQGARLDIGNDVTIYPIGLDIHGNDIIPSHAMHVKADIVITLYDSWVFSPATMSKVRWCPWLPVDSEPLPLAIKRALQCAYQPIAYSQYGFEKLKEAGFDPRYVPHGIELDVYKPADKLAARQKLGLPEEGFVAAMVAANKGTPARKAFFEILCAWREFVKQHEDATLYLHTHPGPEMTGLNLPEVLELLDMPKDSVIFCDVYWNQIGFPDRYMVDVYNAADVLVNASYGEGFGLPVLEAQACGTPVIVGNWTAMPELLFAGWKVGGQPFWVPTGAWQYIPYISDIAAALEEAYRAQGSEALAKDARKGAMPYDADLVTMQYWQPVLAELEEEIKLGGALESLDLSQ